MPARRTVARTTAVVERRPVASAPHRRTTAAPSQALRRRLDSQGTLIARAVGDAPRQRVTQTASVSVQASKATRLPAKVSKPNDPAELEAEEIARKVSRMTPPPAAVSKPAKRSGKDVVHRAETTTLARASTPPTGGGGGAPLPAPVRRFMEPRFGADFGNVRIHTGASAARDSAALSARAFTVAQHVYFGRDNFQPQSASGRELIAHELAHTIQQGTTVQRSVDTTVRQQSSGIAQRWGLGSVRDWIADAANNLPGFRILCLVLGFNPINNIAVDRSPANFVRGVVELMPGGKLIGDALANHGILDRVATWLEGKLADLRRIGSTLRQSIGRFIEERGLADVGRMGEVWESAKRLFTEPADRLRTFVITLVSDVLQFIRQAILLPLARLAEGTAGYDLLKAVLGEDPVTKERVVPSAENLIGGFMKLIQQQEVWENIKKANAIPRAWAWFQQAVAGARALVARIPVMFIETLQALDVSDLVLLPRAFGKVVGLFGRFVGDFMKWGANAVWKLLELIFEVVSPATLTYLRRTGEALWNILKNPLPFMRNLIRAATTGFRNFADHFGTHLKAGLIEWLTGALPGVYIPKSFALGEIVKLVFSVLGLTWQNLRGKLVKVVGETPVKAMEAGFDIVVTLVREGPAAAWEKIKEELAALKDTVIGGIIDLVVDTVVKKAIPKLLAMFIPGAGFVQAIISIYDTIMVFVQKLARIAQVVRGFVDSIVSVAGGAIDAAAKRVEDSLAGILSLAINFLAGFFGAGNIATKVMGVITKIRASVDKTLDKLVAWIANAARKVGRFAASTARAVVGWWKEKLGFTNKDGETHTLQFIGEGDSARLGIASNLTAVRSYLDNHPDKGTPDWSKASSVFEDAMKVVFSPAAKSADERNRRALIKKELARVSAAFARLSGDPPTAADYGEKSPPTYGATSKVDVMYGEPAIGSVTGAWPTDKKGYREIHEAGLTTATDKWVQMHIISEKLGGSGTDFANLVPAPNSVNTGPFRSFEHSTKALVAAKSGKVKNRVWLEVQVMGPKHAATGIKGRSGLYFWKGRQRSPKWLKNGASFTAAAGIPKPQLQEGPRKLVLNFTSGTEMTRDFKLSGPIATLVKEGRPYASKDAFEKSMSLRGARDAQIAGVLARNPVLNGP